MSTIMARLSRNAVRHSSVPGRPYSKKAHYKKLLEFVKISPEVDYALKDKVPVVALESGTIAQPNTTHGLPYPGCVEYAIRAEQMVRRTGAVPATISVIDGFVRVGTLMSVLDFLGSRNALKVSTRDLPYILGMDRLCGGCTVAATMVIAEMVGIKVLATGGIGGVHRAAPLMMDISADVGELGRTNVAVVCSGPKPYLDAEGTVEYLETRGVPVATFRSARAADSMENPMGDPIEMRHVFGAEDMKETMVPGFYSHSGRVESPLVIGDAKEAAQIIHASHEMGLDLGQLFCNPIPHESEVSIDVIEKTVRSVFKQARKKNKRNKEDINHIVYMIRKFARGEALIAERALLLNNAKMGAQIAIELSKLEGGPGKVETPIPEMPKIGIRRPPSISKASAGQKNSNPYGNKLGTKLNQRERLKRAADSNFYLKGMD